MLLVILYLVQIYCMAANCGDKKVQEIKKYKDLKTEP